jgi:hypothetical protein
MSGSYSLKQLFSDNLHNTFKFLGENPNSAIYVAVAIAAFKGLFRPIFTLTDKKSDPQTKKYTATREFLTEMIAIPVYIAVPLLGEKLFVNKNASNIVKKATAANIKFLGVLASTAIIPAVCNVVQQPMMNYVTNYFSNKRTKTLMAQNNPVTSVGNTNKPSFSGNNPLTMRNSQRYNYGMRVGS